MTPFIYWVYFEKVGRPEKIVVPTMMEFIMQLRHLIDRTGEMPEWIVRAYK
jgi:hypothetical protein